MNMKKVLDIADSPISMHTNYAMPLSIILTKKQFYYWYLERFIQIICNGNKNGYAAYLQYFDRGPAHDEVLEKESYDVQDIDSKKSIKEYVISKIESGFYIKLRLDNFYLNCAAEHLIVHNNVPMLIYGYDSENETLFGLTYDKFHIFKKLVISFDELMHGHAAKYTAKGIDYDTLLFKPFDFDYKFNLSIFKQNLSNYYNSIETNDNPLLKSEKIRFYGINAYRDFSEHLKLLLNNDDITTVYHNFHLFWEHKKLLLERINFLKQEYDYKLDLESIQEEYKEFVKLTDSIRLLYIKTVLSDTKNANLYSPIRNKAVIKNLADKIEIIVDREEALIYKLLNIL